MTEEAIAMCPENPMGYFNLGWVYHHDYCWATRSPPGRLLRKVWNWPKKPLPWMIPYPVPTPCCAISISIKRDYDKAIAEGERAMALNPGAAVCPCQLCLQVYTLQAGRKKPFRYSRKQSGSTPSVHPIYIAISAMPSGIAGRFEEAVSAYKKAIQIAPDNITAHLGLAVTYSLMGREKEARAEAAEVLRINPKFSLDYYAKTLPYKDQSARDKIVGALRKAGLK